MFFGLVVLPFEHGSLRNGAFDGLLRGILHDSHPFFYERFPATAPVPQAFDEPNRVYARGERGHKICDEEGEFV